uniref:receptor protein-tyrosine kinase n=1 Tax=Acrobeloides nanus TaxID=290746 RepID=A0A914DHV1_9BILA
MPSSIGQDEAEQLFREIDSMKRIGYHEHVISMLYIASKNIVHRDLAARNILLTDGFNAKISDFGLSMINETGENNTGVLPKKLPVKWLSIEAITRLIFSEKSDVWAFGVLMYEMFSYGKVPYPDFFDKNSVVSFLLRGKRLECPETVGYEIYQIMLECWAENPEERPNFETLVEKFRKIIDTATVSYGYVE